LNRTINVDTGCVFGGKLTALRYPEKEFVSVSAHKTYYEPAKPLMAAQPTTALSQQHEQDDILEIDDVIGKRIVETRLHRNQTVREENAIAAFEVRGRFATNPKWLIYLPPTMSPSETSQRQDLLEHPTEAFDYFRKSHVEKVICEQKHMGSRAVVIVCRKRDAALRRFGVTQDEIGICYTRTGRRFFNDSVLEREFLGRIQTAATSSGLWEELKTDWLCLDCELMPWSSKAQDLLRRNVGPLLGRRTAAGKQPFCFEVNSGDLFAFAGLWDGWQDSSGQWVKTCSILTTTPNAVTATVHDRMPVILHPDSYNLWLDPECRMSQRSRNC
jgi:protein phosphatase